MELTRNLLGTFLVYFPELSWDLKTKLINVTVQYLIKYFIGTLMDLNRCVDETL